MVIGDSHTEEIKVQVRDLVEHVPVDFLFIDGDHSYQGVRKDYEMYSALVRKGGLIAFHDILYEDETGGVAKFWRELKASHNSRELVHSSGMGIGVIWI